MSIVLQQQFKIYKTSIKTMAKINQSEIDQLLKQSDQQQEQSSKKKIDKKQSNKQKQKQKVSINTKLNKRQSIKSDKKDKTDNQYSDNFQQQDYQNQVISQHQETDNYGDQEFQHNNQNQQQQQQVQQIDQESQKNQKAVTNKKQQTKINKKQSKKQIKQEQQLGEQLDKIQSQYASQAIDQVHESLVDSKQQNDKDDDLSLAQSQFIESGRLDQDHKKPALIKKQSKQKIIQKKKQTAINTKLNKKDAKIETNKAIDNKNTTISKFKKSQDNIKNNKANKNQQTKKDKKIETRDQKSKTNLVQNRTQKKTEQQYQQALQQIIQQKKKFEQKKNKKKLQEQEKTKIAYQEALAKQQQRKIKNKAILQQQQKKKKDLGNTSRTSGIKKLQKDADIEAKAQIDKQKNQAKQYKYKDITAQRKQTQKQLKVKIEQQNAKKLKQLQTKKVNKKVKGQQIKQQFLNVKKNMQNAKEKQKKQQIKQQQLLLVKKVKKQIKEIKDQNEQKRKKIFDFDKTIQFLKKQLKQKQKQYYQIFTNIDGQADQKKKNVMSKPSVNYSDLSPIEQFVSFYPQAKNPQQIFKLIDQNNDGMLTTLQILSKIKREGVPDSIAQQVHKILDKNSDGNVTPEEFAFNIQTQIKRQQDFRNIMGEVQFVDPIDIEAKIIDMRAKLGYMDKKIKQQSEGASSAYQQKYQQYTEKIQKIQEKQKNRKNNLVSNKPDELINANAKNMLIQQSNSIESKLQIQRKLIQNLRQSFEKNLSGKNRVLMMRVEQNLKLKEKLYQLKNQIQQTQLRFLSLKKIQQNKKGYLQKQTKERAQMKQLHMKANQYQVRISDPTKQLKNKMNMQQLEFLAAVIMIQRNYRKRKAMRILQEKKKEAAS